jgi:PhnB protein
MPLHFIPEGFRTLTPYLIVKGATALLDFLQQAFAAEIVFCSRRPDGTVGHACVRIGDSVLEISEARPEWPAAPAVLHIYLPDADAGYERALKAGGTSLYPPATRFYGDREAGIKDAWGNSWFIATHVEDVPPAELEKRAAAAM